MSGEEYARLLSALRDRTGLPEGPLSLVSFTLAGVQTFLDSARTTRDVWNGSYLMSYLMWKATEKALETTLRTNHMQRCDTQSFVLIPAIEKQPFWQLWACGSANNLDVAHFPNTVLLIVPHNATQASGIAKEMELAVESAWNDICEDCQTPLRSLLKKGVSGQLWDYQLSWRRDRRCKTAWQQVFEIYSSVCQVPEPSELDDLSGQLGLDPYRGAAGRLFELSMRLLTARKALRDFEQTAQEGHRCSLCGSRSALANYEPAGGSKRAQAPLSFSAKKLDEFWEEVQRIDSLKYAFRDGERLCAVCVVRRLAPVFYFQRIFPQIQHRIYFPSTSTIATAAWVRDVLAAANSKQQVYAAVANFACWLRQWQKSLNIDDPPEALLPYFEKTTGQLRDFARCDGRWFYEESYAPGQLRRDRGDEPGAPSDKPSPFPKLMDALRGQVESSPDDYIAVILADGDRMGEWMSGRYKREDFSLKWLGRLSAALADFANEACRRLEGEIPAKIVYAGGDDLLAFAPGACVLKALEILDQAFDQQVRQPFGFTREDEPNPSLSVACVLAKHNEPLRGLISRAHELLKQGAKERLGRNAFAIYRTTAGVEAGAPFCVGNAQTLPLLIALFTAMRRQLSPRVRYTLEHLSDGLRGWTNKKALQVARGKLIRHAFERHSNAPSDSPQVKTLCHQAEQLFQLLSRWAGYKPGAPVDSFRTFIDLLGVLQFLSRQSS